MTDSEGGSGLNGTHTDEVDRKHTCWYDEAKLVASAELIEVESDVAQVSNRRSNKKVVTYRTVVPPA